MIEPVLRPSKGNIRGLFLCHFTRHLKSLVFSRITGAGGGAALIKIQIPGRFKSRRPAVGTGMCVIKHTAIGDALVQGT